MVEKNYTQENVFLFESGLIVPAVLKCLLLREARAQPPNLVNLSGAENFRSSSLASRDDYVRHKNHLLLVINYLLSARRRRIQDGGVQHGMLK